MTGAEALPRVRRANPDDAAAIARVYVESWRAAYAGLVPDHVLIRMSEPVQSRHWRNAIRGGGDGVLVAEDGADEIVGMTGFGRARAPSFGCDAEVSTLYVLPDAQDQGYGRALLCGAFQALRQAGCGSVLIWVLAANPARFFYTNMGGIPTATRQEALWGTELDEEGYVWPDIDAFLGGNGPCSATRI